MCTTTSADKLWAATKVGFARLPVSNGMPPSYMEAIRFYPSSAQDSEIVLTWA